MIFSSLCTYLCFLGLILTLKKPVCIDSTVVERLDTVSFVGVLQTTDTAYRCSANVMVPYSQNLIQTEDIVSRKIKNISSVLNSIRSFKKKIHLTVRYDQPLMFAIQNSQLQIGSSLLNADGHLQRGLIKIWLRENMPKQFIQASLFEESIADLIYYSVNGDLSIEDPLTGIKTKLGSAQWPQVLKGADAYCESAWRSSEHFYLCGQLQTQANEALAGQMLNLSLRPLVTSSLISSYKNLSFKNQQNLISHIDQFLQKRDFSSDQLIGQIIYNSN